MRRITGFCTGRSDATESLAVAPPWTVGKQNNAGGETVLRHAAHKIRDSKLVPAVLYCITHCADIGLSIGYGKPPQ
jgi:hypothetical protein